MPGVGKTQLAMQLCVDTAIPTAFGGVEGESVYIDSEGSFSPERIYEMAKELVVHLVQSANRKRSVQEMMTNSGGGGGGNEAKRDLRPNLFWIPFMS